MSEHAAIVPTSLGPVGAVVSEPEGERRGALILLQGGGPPCRAGIHGVFTRLARDLARRGIVVLRFDFAGEGDSLMTARAVPRRIGWKRDLDLTIARDATTWFWERIDGLPLFVAGTCLGARVGLELAVGDPRVGGTFLVVPYLSHIPPNRRERPLEPGELDGAEEWAGRAPGSIEDDEALLEGFRALIERGPTCILIGDRDKEQDRLEVESLVRNLGEAAQGLDLEVVPGYALHPVIRPDVQEIVSRLLTERLMAAYGEHQPVP